MNAEMDTKFEIETEYLRVLELTRKANSMRQKYSVDDDLEFKPVLRIPKTYLTQLDKMEDSSPKEDIVGVLQRSMGSESETVMTTAEFETKLEVMERMSTSSGGDTDATASTSSMEHLFFNYNMQQHTLIGVASVALNCIKSATAVVEWDLPVVSPSGLMSGKLVVNLQLLYVNSANSVVNDDDSDDAITVGSQICLKVDVVQVNNLPSFYGNFLFGQYDLFGQSQPTVFYSEDQSTCTRSSYDDSDEVSVEFNHCQVHVVDVTEKISKIINRGYFVIELWGHQGSSFLEQASDDSHSRNHMQLWVQVLEKANEDNADWQPALVEEDALTNTGGVFVLAKAKRKRLRVQLVSPSRRVRCLSISLLGITRFSNEPVTDQQWGVQPYHNVISSAWNLAIEQYEDDTKGLPRKMSQPHLVPSAMLRQNLRQKSFNYKTSHTPNHHKITKPKKDVPREPFLERRMSYPEKDTLTLSDVSKMLRPVKCRKHNEAIAEWDSFSDLPASCAVNWFCDVIVTTTVQASHSKTMEFTLRKRICVKVLDDKYVDNYTSFITGYGCRKIGTKSGALFDISPKDTKHKTIDRRDSMTYIEVFKGENADVVFKERLQHISELHKRRLKSSASFDSCSSEWEMPKLEEEEDEQKSNGHSTKLFRQSEIDLGSLKEIADENQEQNTDNQKNQDHVDDLNTNASNNNFNGFVIGEKVIVNHENHRLFGHVRFIGYILFADKEQIGIELEEPYGNLDGSMNGVSYFKCKADHGIFTTRDNIVAK